MRGSFLSTTLLGIGRKPRATMACRAYSNSQGYAGRRSAKVHTGGKDVVARFGPDVPDPDLFRTCRRGNRHPQHPYSAREGHDLKSLPSTDCARRPCKHDKDLLRYDAATCTECTARAAVG